MNLRTTLTETNLIRLEGVHPPAPKSLWRIQALLTSTTITIEAYFIEEPELVLRLTLQDSGNPLLLDKDEREAIVEHLVETIVDAYS